MASSPAVRLRIYPGGADESPPGNGRQPPEDRALSPEMSLCDFFAAYVTSVLNDREAAPRNLEAYRQSLGMWCRATGDPPLWRVAADPAVPAEFRAWLQRRTWCGRPLSVNTIRKHLGAVQFCLDLAGPRIEGLMGDGRQTNESRPAPRGLYGLDETGQARRVPYLHRPRAVHKLPDDAFDEAEREAILWACRLATVPHDLPGVTAQQWWEALVLWSWNVGTRISATLRLEWTMLDGHRVRMPAEICKGHSPQQAYVNTAAQAAIQPLRAAGKPQIFPWAASLQRLEFVRRRLFGRVLPPSRNFGFHALRKALATELAPRSAIIAQKQLGHGAQNMTADNYVNSRAAAEALESLPQPRPRAGQLRLF